MTCNPFVGASILTMDTESLSGSYLDALTYENRASVRYDRKTLEQVCEGATIMFQAIDKTKYPGISERFKGGVPLGLEEMAEFVRWSNRSVDQTLQFVNIILETDVGYRYDVDVGEYVAIVSDIGDSRSVSYGDLNIGIVAGGNMLIVSPEQRQAAVSIISDYEYFLSKEMSSGIVGAFCSIFANPYKILSIIDDIRNFKIPSMSEIVGGIKDRLSNVIASVIDSVKRKYENLKDSIPGFIGRHKAAMKVFQNRVESLSGMFTEDNIAAMKKKTGSLINKIFSQFREVTKDVLDFIMFRLCQMTMQIEQDIMQPIRNIESMKEVFDYSRKGLQVNSASRSRDYVGAGSVRYSMPDRVKMRDQAYVDLGAYSSLGLDQLVEAVIQTESSGNPNAVNESTGASGLMQVMQLTAQDPGYGVTPMDWSRRFDPDENRRFGTDYLKAMLREFDGDQVRALVAYNWGVGHAKSWDGDMNSLPNETRNYVRKILGASAYSPGSGNAKIEPAVFVAADISEDEMAWVYGLTANGDGNIRFAESVKTMGSVAKAHWERNKRANYDASHNYPDAGWKQIVQTNPSVFIMLRRVSKRMNKPLLINSAFRSVYYNINCTDADTGANSPHSRAVACDVSTRDMSEGHKVEFIKYCSQEGFTRQSVYNTFIHVDIAPGPGRGDWTKTYQGSDKIREAVMMHLSDRFRKG